MRCAPVLANSAVISAARAAARRCGRRCDIGATPSSLLRPLSELITAAALCCWCCCCHGADSGSLCTPLVAGLPASSAIAAGARSRYRRGVPLGGGARPAARRSASSIDRFLRTSFTPQALHRVLAPRGPSRHCGVRVVPHWVHALAPLPDPWVGLLIKGRLCVCGSYHGLRQSHVHGRISPVMTPLEKVLMACFPRHSCFRVYAPCVRSVAASG